MYCKMLRLNSADEMVCKSIPAGHLYASHTNHNLLVWKLKAGTSEMLHSWMVVVTPQGKRTGRNLIGTLPFLVANVIGIVIPKITAEKILFIYSTIYLY